MSEAKTLQEYAREDRRKQRKHAREQSRQERIDDAHLQLELTAAAFIHERDFPAALRHARYAVGILEELAAPEPEGEA